MPKRGMIPPFRKGRLEGFYKNFSNLQHINMSALLWTDLWLNEGISLRGALLNSSLPYAHGIPPFKSIGT
jgi:hypothetical protein